MSLAPGQLPTGQFPADGQFGGRPVEAYLARLAQPLLLAAEHARPDQLAPDELLTPAGVARQVNRDLTATLDTIGLQGLLTRRADVARLVEDEGVTYGEGPSGTPARWRLDPLPLLLEAEAWARLETGLAQRAELLDLVLADLYGPRRLLATGVLPPEVVLGHPGYLRPAVGLGQGARLVLSATDLARGPDGEWTVVGDRAQAPSGAGYAMQNRRIVSRVMPGLYRHTSIRRLRTFFHTVREALEEVAPAGVEVPRVVILTTGQGGETAFDQSFLATLLGYPLVEGGDLTVRGGQVWMRSVGRRQPVDVVLRRVDEDFVDPLELRPDSQLGVAGLLEAARRGAVTVANPVGAGVLENPGLVPFLPALARTLLGTDPILPSAPTWWCGDPASRAHVLAHLDALVIKPIGRGVGRLSRFGWELSRGRQEELRRRIEAEPHAWTAQEPLPMSTAPVVTPGGLEPRHLVLRTFAVAQGGRYHVMAGGLARVAAQRGSLLVAHSAGALAKDVWVVGPQPAPTGAIELVEPGEALTGPVAAAADPGMSPRVAENLFWLGRYAERAEDTVRLVRVAHDLAEDWSSPPGTAGHRGLEVVLRALTTVTCTWPGFVGAGPGARADDPVPELVALSVDASRPGSLAHAVQQTVQAARAVREQLSSDTWTVLGSLERTLGGLVERTTELVQAGAPAADLPLQPALAGILESLLALAGLGAESMVRDTGWYFMDAGRRIERVLSLLALLRATMAQNGSAQNGSAQNGSAQNGSAQNGSTQDGTGLEGMGSDAVRAVVLEAVLVAGESVITHRRRHPGRAENRTVLGLLLLDQGNPRSVAYQLERLVDDLRRLPDAEGEGSPQARVRAVAARMRELDLDTVHGADLDAALAGLHADLGSVATRLELVHFVHTAPVRPLWSGPAVQLATPAGLA